ncbi:MAG: WYL domain-containing protein, partial [Actinomycetes bacterium]
PEMHFSPEESSLLAIASDAWRRSGYSGNSATTLLKLQGAGVPVLDVIDNRIEFTYSPLWKMVAEAILNREVISFQYRRRDGEVTIRELEPYRLHFRSQRWYLIGKDRSRDAIRTFVLTRFIGGLTLSGKSDEFQIPNRFDSSEHIVSALSESQTVTVIASGGAISILRKLASSEKQIDDLFVQFEILVADEEEFLFQLLTQTAEFQVLSPAALRDRAISIFEASHDA